MSTHHTVTGEDDTESAETTLRARGRSMIETHGRSGTLAIALGVILLLGSLRKLRGGGRRGLVAAIAGLALVAVGVRQRRADGDYEGDALDDDASMGRETETSVHDDDDSESSDDASTQLQRPDTPKHAGMNPRDVDEYPDAATGGEDEGDIQFTRDQDEGTEAKPEIEGVDDPRLDEGTDDEAEVEIDISEAAMADEPAEAAGPTSQQSQPTATKDDDTTPEDIDADVSSEDAAEKRVGPDDEADGGDEEAEGEESGAEEADEAGEESGTEDEDDEVDEEADEGQVSVQSDTNQSGTMDVDEEDVTDEDR